MLCAFDLGAPHHLSSDYSSFHHFEYICNQARHCVFPCNEGAINILSNIYSSIVRHSLLAARFPSLGNLLPTHETLRNQRAWLDYEQHIIQVQGKVSYTHIIYVELELFLVIQIYKKAKYLYRGRRGKAAQKQSEERQTDRMMSEMKRFSVYSLENEVELISQYVILLIGWRMLSRIADNLGQSHSKENDMMGKKI